MQLDKDALRLVLRQLPDEEIAAASMVCRRWRDVVVQEKLLEQRVPFNRFGNVVDFHSWPEDMNPTLAGKRMRSDCAGELKVTIIGGGIAVGKTALLIRFLQQMFLYEYA